MRGRSSESENEAAFRAILDDESAPGRLFLAGIAVSYATGMSELAGRRLTERALDLRSPRQASGHRAFNEIQILAMLNRPRRSW